MAAAYNLVDEQQDSSKIHNPQTDKQVKEAKGNAQSQTKYIIPGITRFSSGTKAATSHQQLKTPTHHPTQIKRQDNEANVLCLRYT